MSKFGDITRWLLAAGAATSADGKSTNFLYEENNSLCIKRWTGSEFADKSWVATGVKSGTSAPCITMQGKHLVFCIDKSDILKCYAEPPKKEVKEDDDEESEEEEDELWKEVGLGQANNTTVHPQSQLEANISQKGITVVYQAPDGSLSSIVNKGKNWEVMGVQATNVLPGTPLAMFVSNQKLLLFYVTDKNKLHYLTKNPENDEWTDTPMTTVAFDKPVSRLTIADGEDNSGLAAYCLTDEKLVIVKQSSEKIDVLGTVEKGKFSAATGQESVLVGWQWRPVPIFMDYMPYFWSPW